MGMTFLAAHNLKPFGMWACNISWRCALGVTTGLLLSRLNRSPYRSDFVLSPATRVQVIPGYADAHTPAKLEVPVKLAYSQQAEVEGRAHAVMSRL